MPTNDRNQTLPSPAAARPSVSTAPMAGGPLRRWAIGCGILLAAYSLVLVDLARFSLQSSLFSHIILVPFVSAYLIWTDRSRMPRPESRGTAFALGLGGLAVAVLAGFWSARFTGVPLSRETSLALPTLSLLLLLTANTAWFLGPTTLRAYAFPTSFLVFMLPFPPAVEQVIETFLQHGSASMAALMFQAAGTPLLRDDLIFQLPGITLQVAPECSGIRSSLALFITSLVAGYLFLRSPWRRVLLTVAVIPLALIRNGFRVFTIGELCVHVSPDMIHSWVHKQGGPLFFALSLIPFGLLLLFLVHRERRNPPPVGSQ